MAPTPELHSTLSISQITGQIQNALEQGFASVWVKGEISNLTRHSSGHWYFSLKDSGAQLGAVMFRRQTESVRFEPNHGMEITAHGRISVYPPQGRYQLIVDQMLPAGQGDLHMAFEALKQKLQNEGLFDSLRKKPIPRYPSKIGIITSPTGAAIQDMLNIISRRFPLSDVLLLPVKVQGEGAAGEIASAITTLNQRQDCQVLLVGRGGGSLEDLWAFNEEIVARAISASEIPIISAVGHETDTTISDFVADKRAPTPSAAAELVVPDSMEIALRLDNLKQSLYTNLGNRIDRYSQSLDSIEKSYALRRPQLMIEQSLQNLDIVQDKVSRLTQEAFKNATTKLEHINIKLDALNPLHVLDKGYSVLSDKSGNILKSIGQVSIGDEVKVRVRDGEITTVAKEIKQAK